MNSAQNLRPLAGCRAAHGQEEGHGHAVLDM